MTFLLETASTLNLPLIAGLTAFWILVTGLLAVRSLGSTRPHE